LEWPFSLLAFGIKKTLLLFATTSATFSLVAEGFYHNKWSILFVFIIDSAIFISVLFIPLIGIKWQNYINKIHVPVCAIGRFIGPYISRISHIYGPAKKND
jgi:ABC-type enterochelin transport system permease subunit